MRCEGYMIVTKDIQAATVFYRDIIGAEVELDIGKHVIFRQGFSLLLQEDWLDFAQLNECSLTYPHHTGQLVFEVNDITAFIHHLQQYPAVKWLHPLKQHHWGRQAIRLYDPDGHIVEVGESMKVVVKRFLQQGLSIEEAAQQSEFPIHFVLMCKQEIEEQAQKHAK